MSGSKLRRQSERYYDIHSDAVRRVHKDQNLFYVDSTYEGNATYWSGKRLTSALPTLAAAYAKVTAARGDVVLLSPFHDEDISTALTLSKSYVRYEGLNIGHKKPYLTYSAAGGNITISGANCEFNNIKLYISGTTDVTSPLVLSGAKILMKDCWSYEPTTTDQFVYGVLVTGNDCIIDNYDFFGQAGDANITGIRMTGANGLEIKNSKIVGNFTAAEDVSGAIQGLTTASLNLDIHHNRVENRDGTSEAGMVFVTTDTGFVYENFIAVPTGDFGQGLIGDDLIRQYNNFVVDVATERGAPEGTASA